MSNKEKIIEVFRHSPLTPLSYSDIKATAGVPVGSFDRTLALLVGDGTLVKGDGGYALAKGAGDGSVARTEQTRSPSGFFIYCARCQASHPRPDKASGETLEDVHHRGITA